MEIINVTKFFYLRIQVQQAALEWGATATTDTSPTLPLMVLLSATTTTIGARTDPGT